MLAAHLAFTVVSTLLCLCCPRTTCRWPRGMERMGLIAHADALLSTVLGIHMLVRSGVLSSGTLSRPSVAMAGFRASFGEGVAGEGVGVAGEGVAAEVEQVAGGAKNALCAEAVIGLSCACGSCPRGESRDERSGETEPTRRCRAGLLLLPGRIRIDLA